FRNCAQIRNSTPPLPSPCHRPKAIPGIVHGKMAMSNETKRLEFLGELAGGLAHEIKNPLSTMRLHLEMLEEDWREIDGDIARRSVRKVDLLLKEIRRLEDIVQEFLKVSRGHDLRLT